MLIKDKVNKAIYHQKIIEACLKCAKDTKSYRVADIYLNDARREAELLIKLLV